MHVTVKLFARPRDEDNYVRDAVDRHVERFIEAQRLLTWFGTLLHVLNALLIAGAGAIDAPVDLAPRTQIEEAERRLYEIAEQGRYDGGFQTFSHALTTAIDMAAKAYERDGKLSGIATGLTDLDFKMGGLQPSDLIILAARPAIYMEVARGQFARYGVSIAEASALVAAGRNACLLGARIATDIATCAIAVGDGP